MSMSFDKYDRLTADEPASEVEPDLHTVGYINLRINASVLRKLEKKERYKIIHRRGEKKEKGRRRRRRKEGGERGDKRFIKVKQLWTTATVVSTHLLCLFFNLLFFNRVCNVLQNILCLVANTKPVSF